MVRPWRAIGLAARPASLGVAGPALALGAAGWAIVRHRRQPPAPGASRITVSAPPAHPDAHAGTGRAIPLGPVTSPFAPPPTARPRTLADRGQVRDRLARRFDSQVEPLNRWVEGLRAAYGETAVPWFDPDDGGIGARILWLLEAPGPKATEHRGGSGFISCDNNDGSAQNTWETRTEAGIDRRLVVHWNVVPYYLGDDHRIRAATGADITETGKHLAELLGLLPDLRCVILGGATAQRSWSQFAPPAHGLTVLKTKHPSVTDLNTRPHYRPLIVGAWRHAGQVASGG